MDGKTKLTADQKADLRCKDAFRSFGWIYLKSTSTFINVAHIISINPQKDGKHVAITVTGTTTYMEELPIDALKEYTNAGWWNLSAGLMTDADKNK